MFSYSGVSVYYTRMYMLAQKLSNFVGVHDIESQRLKIVCRNVRFVISLWMIRCGSKMLDSRLSAD